MKEYKSFQQAMLVPSVLVSQRTERKCDFRFRGENGADLWHKHDQINVYTTSTWLDLVANEDFSHILKSYFVGGWLCKLSTVNFQSRTYKHVV